MSNSIRFVLVGCGRIAAKHAAQIQQQGVLVAVCDTDAEKAMLFAHQQQVPWFTNFHTLLEAKPLADVMVICTPNGLHASQSIAAMQAGYHVLVEKPMALSSADAQAMLHTASATGKQLFTVLQNRFNQPVQELKTLLQTGTLGNIYSVQLNGFWHRDLAYYADDWHGTRELDGGMLFTQFSHFIDLLLWLFGPVAHCHSYRKNMAHPGIAIEDELVLLYRFENGILGTAHFSTNAYQQNIEGSITLLTEKASIKIGGTYLNQLSYQYAGETFITDPAPIPANQYGSYEGSASHHGAVYASLVQTLQQQRPYYTSPEESLAVVRLIEYIYSTAT